MTDGLQHRSEPAVSINKTRTRTIMQRVGTWTTAAIAAAVTIAEAAVSYRLGLPAEIILPLALVSGGAVVWVVLALDIVLRRGSTPTRAQVAELLLLQRSQHDFNHAVWKRLQGHDDALRMAILDTDLRDLAPHIVEAARTMERYDGAATQVGAWDALLDQWYAAATGFFPEFITRPSPPDEAQLRAARSRLPFGQNLSSADQKAALHYLVTSDRWSADVTKTSGRREELRAALMQQTTEPLS